MMSSILQTAPEVAPRGASPLLLLDADYLSYMIGGISQGMEKDNSIEGQQLWCADEDKDIWVWIDPLDLVKWRVDNEIEKIKDKFNSDSMEVWLTPHEGNFRNEVAVSRPYKGKRTSARPYHYQAIRDHMVEAWQAEVAVGCEADDMVCIRQMHSHVSGVPSVIVGIDKDLKCMYGHHYNPRKDEFIWVTALDAALNFYGQMITGDTVDNIPGCQGRGVKYWEKLLDKRLKYDGTVDIDWVHQDVYEAYEEKGHDSDYFVEQGTLLHMRRHVDEVWTVDYDWYKGYNYKMGSRTCLSQ